MKCSKGGKIVLIVNMLLITFIIQIIHDVYINSLSDLIYLLQYDKFNPLKKKSTSTKIFSKVEKMFLHCAGKKQTSPPVVTPLFVLMNGNKEYA